MKVAFQGTTDYGGQGTFLIELTKHLSRKVESIDIFPTCLSSRNEEILEMYGKLPSNVFIHQKYNYIDNFIQEIRNYKNFDIVHINYASFGFSSLLSNVFYGTPYVYTIHSPPNLLFGRIFNRFKYCLELNLFLPIISMKAHLATNSTYNRKIISDKYGYDSVVIHHGINYDKFVYSKDESRRFIFDTLGISKEKTILLFVGRFHGYKDIPTLIKSMSSIIDENKDVVLIIIGGGGDSYTKIMHEIRRSNVQQHIYTLDNISDEDLRKFYAGSDIFVFPSIGEGFGIVFLEAMANGLPIVAANAGASAEVIGNAGLLFEPKNTTDFASRIGHLVRDKKLRESLSEKGRETVKNYSWELAAEKYYSLYMQTIKNSMNIK